MHKHKSSYLRLWLPSDENHLLRPHPFCEICGIVKNVSGKKARSMGYYMNILSQMKKKAENLGNKISDVQIRLICKELNRRDFDDIYSLNLKEQQKIFISVVMKYTNLSKSFIESFLI